jgi:hypothetical protein
MQVLITSVNELKSKIQMVATNLYSNICHNHLAFRNNEFADLVISLLVLEFFFHSNFIPLKEDFKHYFKFFKKIGSFISFIM